MERNDVDLDRIFVYFVGRIVVWVWVETQAMQPRLHSIVLVNKIATCIKHPPSRNIRNFVVALKGALTLI
jgi:hypothetical protein